ncbi:ABC transporter substrate-binding protein [Nitratireductor aquimarinus]|uniref:ABC transporter substrate-binding protein n=1 Tax=Alphaproteobacteria TaxID=28211 RepID=UPI000DDFA065|nr:MULTISPECIES: ABC transporter substrate-binding protein [Alphaproteobacteria]MBY6024668.1 ABC transporter substrate-binding protein [Nitratireductor sp. DP7N14-4]MBN7759417.1 ABC transporter substrate-binding protein [Nitratireductor aquimarinus]MBN7760569.1 ABC transporter substrate-binding protein [Nitratireductor aquibiodomus]MBN7776451.1 ABC transporter substrate-binding protein [Nitratireductor pacificus]MBN7779318.1 ABC transporter substrate-binding protein [Nitratireductor pacificus]
MRKTLLASVFAIAGVTGVHAQETEIRVHYAIPTIWADTQKTLADAFMEKHPDVKITLDGAAEGYEDGVQRLLRESVAGTGPDVAYVGLNLWRVLEDRGLAQPLDGFLGDEPLAQGYTPALLSLGRFQDTQYALATSASTLVMYVNPVLVEKAGGSMEEFPDTFDGVIELAAKINALDGATDGVWIGRHDWRFQSLLGSHGGRPMNEDESDITFDGPEGITAAGLYQRFADEAGMKSYSENDARQAFPAGTLGIMFESSSLQTRFTEGAGDKFDLTVKPLPVAAEDKSKVYFPTGGSAIVMLTDDEAKQQAAWDYMAFVTGPEGQKIIVENTGYAPANAKVIEDEAYLGEFYASNPNARVAHTQVANYAGPWYAYPGAEGVAATDLIAASLVEVTEGADAEATTKDLAETLRDLLGMN